MKIGQFINTNDFGGAETLMLSLSQELLKRNKEVLVFAFQDSWTIEQCQNLNIPYYALSKKFKLVHNIRKLPIFAYEFSKVLKENHIDVLHSHVYGATLRGALSCFFAGIKHVATQHDNYSVGEKKTRKIWLNLSGMIGTKLVMISKQMKEFHITHGLKEKYLYTVYNGIDQHRFVKKNNDLNHIKESLNITSKDFVFMTAARLSPIKGIPILIQAAELLNHENPNFKILILGDGPNKLEYEEMVKRYNLTNNILFIGKVNNVEDYLSISDVFVLSSHNEGLPCSIIEAMLSSLPIIATDVGANNELIIDGKTGFLVKPNDHLDLYCYLHNTINLNKHHLEQLSKNSYYYAKKMFTLDKMTDGYSDIYEN